MKFQYSCKQVNGIFVCRPLLWVSVYSPSLETSVSFPCLVDSGADRCLFYQDIAEVMGINIQDGIKWSISGVKAGARVNGYLHENITYNVENITCVADIAFTDELPAEFGILGRDGFFDHFLVNFDERAGEFEVQPYT